MYLSALFAKFASHWFIVVPTDLDLCFQIVTASSV